MCPPSTKLFQNYSHKASFPKIRLDQNITDGGRNEAEVLKRLPPSSLSIQTKLASLHSEGLKLLKAQAYH